MNIQEHINKSFHCTSNSPAAWLKSAWQLKRTSEEIDTFSLPGRGFSNHTENDRDAELGWLTPVYRFLIGQSFENLLKGIIIAQGRTSSSNGKLHKSLSTHSIHNLIELLDNSLVKLTDEDKKILNDLQEYVEWAGRYPISKKANKYKIALGFSNTIHRKEIDLWNRLFYYLKDIGNWFINGDGIKIHLKDDDETP